MPISNEKVQNKSLSGAELVTIIEKMVHDILTRDGMFSRNIAFARVSGEVRVSLHLDNPIYPEHVATVLTRKASIQEVEANSALAAIETAPLTEPLSEEATVFSEETHFEIASPNMARVEHDMPIIQDKKNLDTGVVEQREVKYTGDMPDPATVGNTKETKATVADQRVKWKVKK